MKYSYIIALLCFTACISSGEQEKEQVPNKKEVYLEKPIFESYPVLEAQTLLEIDFDIDKSLIEVLAIQGSYHGFMNKLSKSTPLVISTGNCGEIATPRIVCSILYKNAPEKSIHSFQQILSDTTKCKKYLFYGRNNQLDSVQLLLKLEHWFPKKTLNTFNDSSYVSFLYADIYNVSFLDDTNEFREITDNILYIKLIPCRGNSLLYKQKQVNGLKINKSKNYSITRILNNDQP